MAVSGVVISLNECKRFMVDCLRAVGAHLAKAEQLADVLVAADYRGHFSHGLNRLEIYVSDVETKVCSANAEPKILKESAATAWVDGNNGFGPVVGAFCMDLAIKKAKEAGVAVVTAKGSNHYGIAGWYALRALEHQLIGMSFTNTSPLLVPTRAKNAALGTNPIAFAAPGSSGDSVVVDMATTTVAVGKIEVNKTKNLPIPSGWALDETGQVSTDAARAFEAKKLLPLGGIELNSGYKGYGLSLMVEVLCGVLAGGECGPQIRRWGSFDRPADVAQCFIAIDPECFAPSFQGRLSELMDILRGMEPSDETLPVQVPGDPERNHMKLVDSQGGVFYHTNQINISKQLADRLGVLPLQKAS